MNALEWDLLPKNDPKYLIDLQKAGNFYHLLDYPELYYAF